MGWSGGSFTRDNGDYTGATVWQDDKTNGFKIQASRHDTHDQDLAAGINACLNKDGSNSPTAQFTWLKSQYYAPTVGGTAAAQTITMSPAHTSYQTGELIIFKPSAMSTGATTLSKNALVAKTIKRMDGGDLQPGDLDTTRMAAVVYDGTNYILISSQDARPVLRSTVFSSTNNSTTETEVLSYTVPANTLKPSASNVGRKIRARSVLISTNGMGVDGTVTIKAKLGSSTWMTSAITIGSSASSLPIRIDCEIVAANSSTTVQCAFGEIVVPDIGPIPYQIKSVYADPGRDITTALDFKITATMNTADAAFGFTQLNAFVELL